MEPRRGILVLPVGGGKVQSYWGLAGMGQLRISRLFRDAHICSRVSELQAAAAERLIEKTTLDRAWALTRLQENVERSMEVTAVLDSGTRQ